MQPRVKRGTHVAAGPAAGEQRLGFRRRLFVRVAALTENSCGVFAAALAVMFQGPGFEDVPCHDLMLAQQGWLEPSSGYLFPAPGYRGPEQAPAVP